MPFTPKVRGRGCCDHAGGPCPHLPGHVLDDDREGQDRHGHPEEAEGQHHAARQVPATVLPDSPRRELQLILLWFYLPFLRAWIEISAHFVR